MNVFQNMEFVLHYEFRQIKYTDAKYDKRLLINFHIPGDSVPFYCTHC